MKKFKVSPDAYVEMVHTGDIVYSLYCSYPFQKFIYTPAECISKRKGAFRRLTV
jgi:hypothetical protein